MSKTSTQFKKGQTPWNKGRVGVSDVTRMLMRLSKVNAGIIPPSRKGIKLTEETLSKLKGKLAWNKGKKGAQVAWNKGKTGLIKHSFTTKRKMSESHKGSRSPYWQRGITKVYDAIRNCFEYRQWRNDVFRRDKFSCQCCGDKKGGNLEADHIKPFSLILRVNKITSLQGAIDCLELWDTRNGRTLCTECHKKTDTYGSKTSKLINKII